MVRSLVLAALTAALSSTFGVPLVPAIARETGSDLESAQWVLTVTLLVGAATAPAISRAGAIWGARRVLACVLLCIATGSLSIAINDGLGQIIAGRALQGVGYASIPLTIGLASALLSEPARSRSTAALSITLATGAGAGYALSGGIAELGGYRLVFLVSGGLAVVSLAMLVAFVPATSASAPATRDLDLAGTTLFAAAMATLVLALSRATDWGWGSAAIIGLLGTAFALLSAWIFVELRTPNPMVDVRLLRHPDALAANGAAVLLGLGTYVGISVAVLLVQAPRADGGLGGTAIVAGLLLTPLSLGSVVSPMIVRSLRSYVDVRGVAIAGASLVTIALTFLAVSHRGYWSVGVCAALLGVGLGCAFATMPALLARDASPLLRGNVMSVNQVSRVTGGAVGSALSAMVIAAGGGFALSPTRVTVAFGIGAVAAALAALTGAMLITRNALPKDAAPGIPAVP
jgi:MFS family permease